VIDWICRWECYSHPDYMIVTVYDKYFSDTDRDYTEWFCPKLRVHVESDGKPPEGCPFWLEHTLDVEQENL